MLILKLLFNLVRVNYFITSMKNYLTLLSLFKSDNWAKNGLQKRALGYFYDNYLKPFVDNMTEYELQLYSSNNYQNLIDAFKNDAFKYGIINFFFSNNDYRLDAKQLAVGISMGTFGHSNDGFLDVKVYNISERLIQTIAHKAKKDFILKSMLSSYGKDLSYISTKLDAEDIINTLRDKKLVFNSYFKKFEQKDGADIVTIYHPAYGESWIAWRPENTIKIRMTHSMPKGLILMMFDYKSILKGNLRQAVETKKEVLFNPSNNPNGQLIWLN